MKAYSYITALILGALSLTACHSHRHHNTPHYHPTERPVQRPAERPVQRPIHTPPSPNAFPPPIEMW
ncbi:MAG: hypothetical protein IKJ58_08895 [Akkermansia sp.]|nr:hypothetical protein [Akkermansia sp.]